MTTVFSRILAGEIPGTFVARTPTVAALMSINPLATGHVLVIPVEEYDEWLDVPAELGTELYALAHRVGVAQRAAFGCARVGLIIAGYEVPHTHLHVIPTASMAQLDFANAATEVSRTALESAAEAIRRHLPAE